MCCGSGVVVFRTPYKIRFLSHAHTESNYSGNSSTVADDCDRAVYALVRVCVLLQSSSCGFLPFCVLYVPKRSVNLFTLAQSGNDDSVGWLAGWLSASCNKFGDVEMVGSN